MLNILPVVGVGDNRISTVQTIKVTDMMDSKINTLNQDRVNWDDYVRLTTKAAKAIVGEYELSEISATAAHNIMIGRIEQEKKGKSHAGSRSKRKDGIESAVIFYLNADSTLSAKQIWEHISTNTWESEKCRWVVEIEDDKMFQVDNKSGKTHKISLGIKFSTFNREYVRTIKKQMLSDK